MLHCDLSKFESIPHSLLEPIALYKHPPPALLLPLNINFLEPLLLPLLLP